MHIFFSPLDLHFYITLKHVQTPAGLKGGFKNRIIAISLIVSHKEQLSQYLRIFFTCYLNGLASVLFGESGTLWNASLRPISDADYFLHQSYHWGEICYLDTCTHPFKNMLPRFPELITSAEHPPACLHSIFSKSCVKYDTFKMYSVSLKQCPKMVFLRPAENIQTHFQMCIS